MTRPHPVTDTNQRGALNRVGNVEQQREPRMFPSGGQNKADKSSPRSGGKGED